jgi:hypothetical protein
MFGSLLDDVQVPLIIGLYMYISIVLQDSCLAIDSSTFFAAYESLHQNAKPASSYTGLRMWGFGIITRTSFDARFAHPALAAVGFQSSGISSGNLGSHAQAAGFLVFAFGYPRICTLEESDLQYQERGESLLRDLAPALLILKSAYKPLHTLEVWWWRIMAQEIFA